MKRIIVLLMLLFASQLSAQYQWFKIGSTKLTDSVGYFTVSRSTLVHGNIFVKGAITFDTLSKGRIEYLANDIQFTNDKPSGGFTFWMGDKLPKFFINMLIEDFPGYIPLVVIDSTGVDLLGDGMQYKIGGTPISSSGASNLFGYMHKDTAFSHTQHLKTKTFTIWAGATDSARFTVKGGTGDLTIEPSGSNVIFGSSSAVTGTKNVYALNYFVGDSAYYNKTTTWSRMNIFQDTLKTKFISGLNDDSVIIKPRLRIKGDLTIDGTAIHIGGAVNSIYKNSNDWWFGGLQMRVNTQGVLLGNGDTGDPFAQTQTGVQYSFYNDQDAGVKWNSTDNISLITGNVPKITIDNTSISFLAPGKIFNMTEAQRDLLSPESGWTIFNTDSGKLNFYNGSAWEVVTSAP